MKRLLHLVAALLPLIGLSQARIIFNGANIRITQNSFLIIDNPSPDAITVSGTGGIFSEAADNNLIWNIGTQAANYKIPFISGNNSIPLSFSTSGGVGNGRLTLSTYAGPDWQNSLYLPPSVSSMNINGVDNSSHAIDRFWQINPSGYTTNPLLSSLIFSYNDNEWNETGNNITEGNLAAENWNSNTSTWSSAPTGTDDPSLNQVTIAAPGGTVYYPWWTLLSNDFDLPLTLLNFSVEKANGNALLQWLVTAEINVDYYEVQRSINAVDFFPVGSVASINSSSTTTGYSFTDDLKNINSQIIYYRLRMVDRDGKFSYSPVKYISSGDRPLVQVFPNPVADMLVIRFGSQAAGNYQVSLFTADGRRIMTREIPVTANSTFYFPRGTHIAAGMYMLNITGKELTQSFTLYYQ